MLGEKAPPLIIFTGKKNEQVEKVSKVVHPILFSAMTIECTTFYTLLRQCNSPAFSILCCINLFFFFFVFSESLMQCQFTDEEWRYLNDIYNENDAVDGNIVHNDSDIVIF